jgi:Uma2 family endonuclease
MTVEQFIDWAMAQPGGRYELHGGQVIPMTPERTGHLKAKHKVMVALERAIEQAGLRCFALPDGATVRVDDRTAFEPDALVYCGDELPDDTVVIPEPAVVAEVVSPSSEARDAGLKLAGYFRVPSLRHYLIVDPKDSLVIHHRRADDGSIATSVIEEGEFALDPPGLTLRLAALFPAS